MAENKQDLLAEAYRRGILPAEKKQAYEEAMRRGLVPNLIEDSPERDAVNAAKTLVRSNSGYREPSRSTQRLRERFEKTDRNLAGAFDTFTNLPFSNEYTGAVNAGYSAAYNLPGLVRSGDFDEFGGRVAKAYDSQVKGRRQNIRDFREENPNTAAAVQGTSLGLQGVGAAKALPGTVANTGNLFKDMLLQGTSAGAQGAAWSWLYGVGDNEGGSLEQRLERGQEFAKFGAAGGGVLGAGMRGAPAAYSAIKNQRANSAPGQLLDMSREAGSEVSRSSGNALVGLLKRAGYARKDIDRGIREIGNGLQAGVNAVERPSIFAVELQKRFPAASQQIEDAFQQLATAPPKQGNTSQVLLGAIDDQQASQGKFLDDVFQERLGITTIADEQAALAAERASIGKAREQVIKYAPTDRRISKELRGNIGSLLDDIGRDARARPRLQQAARELGYSGSAQESISSAIADDPFALLQKFGQVARESQDDVVKAYRAQSEKLFDDISRAGPRTEHGGFAKQVPDGEVGPYKVEQRRFAQNYSQEDAIKEARGRFAAARDPVKADEFVGWYNSLPAGEQQLVKTVIRQDMEKMLRGGNIDNAGAYLTNLRKQGVHDVLVRILGKDGEDISRAIQNIADEQPMLSQIDPRAGMQARVVRGGAAQRARNLYTNNPVARLGDRLPAGGGFMMDAGLMASGQLPYVTMARQASKMFRPGTQTREGLANIFAMRPANAFAPQARLTPTPAPSAPQGPPPRSVVPPSEQKALPGPSSAVPAATVSQAPPASPRAQSTPKPTPRTEPRRASVDPRIQEIHPDDLLPPERYAYKATWEKEQVRKRKLALLSPEERMLPPEQQLALIERRENWHKQPQSRVTQQPTHQELEPAYEPRPESGPLGKAAALGVVTSPVWGIGGLLAYVNMRSREGTKTPALETAAQAVERVSQRLPSAPSLKPRGQLSAAQAEQSGVLLSSGGTKFYDEETRQWRPIEELQGN